MALPILGGLIHILLVVAVIVVLVRLIQGRPVA
ncbi:MAG: lmo0937 family membrane protein [Fimbriimonadales bacterium]